MNFAAVYYFVLFAAEVIIWWIPYLTVPSGRWRGIYNRLLSWYVGFCPEVPEANGQGRTSDECFQSLKEAVLLLMEDRREDARRRLAGDVRVLELA